MKVYRTKSGFCYKELKSGKKKRISKDEYLKLSKSKQTKKSSPKQTTSKIYRTKNGYFYKELKNGKKKRISKEEYLKLNKKKKSKSSIKKMSGGDPTDRLKFAVHAGEDLVVTFFLKYSEKEGCLIMTSEKFKIQIKIDYRYYTEALRRIMDDIPADISVTDTLKDVYYYDPLFKEIVNRVKNKIVRKIDGRDGEEELEEGFYIFNYYLDRTRFNKNGVAIDTSSSGSSSRSNDSL